MFHLKTLQKRAEKPRAFLTNEGRKGAACNCGHYLSDDGALAPSLMSEVLQAIQTIRHCRRCPVREKRSSFKELILAWAGTGHYHLAPAEPTPPIKAMFHKAMIIFNVYDMYSRFHCGSREMAKSLAVFQVSREVLRGYAVPAKNLQP
jgi:hypothetical protein